MKTDEEKAFEDRMATKSLTICLTLFVGSVAAGVAASSTAVGIAVFTLIFAVFEFAEYLVSVIFMRRKRG